MKKLVYILIGLVTGLIIVQVIVYFASSPTVSPVISGIVSPTEASSLDMIIPAIDEPSQPVGIQSDTKVVPAQTNESQDIQPVYEAPIQGVVIVN